jgi:hypothetical protein
MSDNDSSKMGTWVGSLAGAVSALVALLTAYKIQFDPKPTIWWLIACLVEAAIVIMLTIYILRKRPVSLPRGIRTRNRKILVSLFESISNDFKAQVSELSRSQLSLYGRQVRNAQVHLLASLLKESKAPQVRATDIVRRLDLWPTRGVYLRANSRFVQSGGKTTRIFLISKNLINSDENAKEFWEIMEIHKGMGVEVALHIVELLSPEYAEDYVIYSRDCVLVEIEQGDVEFSRGKVTVFFNSNIIDTYLRRFDYLETSNDTKSASEVYDLYRKFFALNGEGSMSFPDRKAAFIREAR